MGFEWLLGLAFYFLPAIIAEGTDHAASLRRLAALNSGLITDEEFHQKRAQILSRM